MMTTMQATQATPVRPAIERQPVLPDGAASLRWRDGRWIQARQALVPAHQASEPAVAATPAAEALATTPGEPEAAAGRTLGERLATLVALLAPGRRTAEGASR
jgi:hypothetical protein